MALIAKETVQILAIVFFSILTLGGVVLLVTGAVFEAQTEQASEYFDDNFRIPAILAIVAGVCCLLGALLGLFGAVLLGLWLLVAGIVLVFIALVLSLVGGAIAYDTRSQKECVKWDTLAEQMIAYGDNQDNVDKVQKTFKCCGYLGGESLNASGKFPKSCCKGEPDDCSPTNEDLHEGGCRPALINYQRMHGLILLGVALILCLFMLFAIIFGALFAWMFWKKGKEGGGTGGGNK